MQLVMSKASPYVRKVRVMLRETGLSPSVEEVEVATSPLDSAPQAVAANPLGRIPALVREDGPALYDSRVICRWIDTTAGAGLYPEGRLWEVLTLEATAEGLLDSAVSSVYEARFKGTDGASAAWIEAQWQKIERALRALDTRWMSHLAGPLDAGQIATGCALGYLDFRLGERDWRAVAPDLAAWYARFSERPAMLETAPPSG